MTIIRFYANYFRRCLNMLELLALKTLTRTLIFHTQFFQIPPGFKLFTINFTHSFYIKGIVNSAYLLIIVWYIFANNEISTANWECKFKSLDDKISYRITFLSLKTFIVNIYTLSDLGVLSNPIGSLSRTVKHYYSFKIFPRF